MAVKNPPERLIVLEADPNGFVQLPILLPEDDVNVLSPIEEDVGSFDADVLSLGLVASGTDKR